jgi:environmental stress-induced protein Ves
MTPSLQVVEAGRVSAQPWRNGGGLTRELCTWPPGAAWQVRVSVADITRMGRWRRSVICRRGPRATST